jgi:hypothetical protein
VLTGTAGVEDLNIANVSVPPPTTRKAARSMRRFEPAAAVQDAGIDTRAARVAAVAATGFASGTGGGGVTIGVAAVATGTARATTGAAGATTGVARGTAGAIAGIAGCAAERSIGAAASSLMDAGTAAWALH